MLFHRLCTFIDLAHRMKQLSVLGLILLSVLDDDVDTVAEAWATTRQTVCAAKHARLHGSLASRVQVAESAVGQPPEVLATCSNAVSCLHAWVNLDSGVKQQMPLTH